MLMTLKRPPQLLKSLENEEEPTMEGMNR